MWIYDEWAWTCEECEYVNNKGNLWTMWKIEYLKTWTMCKYEQYENMNNV